MTEPTDFSKGSPHTEEILVHHLTDLEEKRSNLTRNIQLEINNLESSLDFSTERSPLTGQKTLESIIERTRQGAQSSLHSYQAFLESCQVNPSLKPEESRLLLDSIEGFKAETEDLKLVITKKLAKAEAKIQTKWYWKQVAYLKEALKTKNFSGLEDLFDKKLIQKNFEQFRVLLRQIDETLESTRHLSGIPLYDAMIEKGRALEIKEDLIIAFLEYKRALRDDYPLYISKHPSLKKTVSTFERSLLQNLSKQQEIHPAEKHAEILLKGEVTTNAKNIAKASLTAATFTLAAHSSTAIRDCSTASSSLTAGIGLPLAILSTYQMIRNASRSRVLHRRIAECKEIQKLGDLTNKEGQSLRAEARGLLEKSHTSEKEALHLGEMLKRSTELLTIGSELKEKAFITESELQKELETITLTIFGLALATLLDLVAIGRNIVTLIDNAKAGLISAASLNILHFVGIASGAIGLIVGSVRTIMVGKAIYETEIKLKNVKEKLTRLESLKASNPLFYEMELTHLSQELALLKAELRNKWISLANNLLLTIAGVLGLIAFIGIGVATGGIAHAALAITVLSAIIVFAHYYKQKEWKVETKAIQTEKILENTTDFSAIIKYLALKEEELIHFERSPRIYLENYFKHA